MSLDQSKTADTMSTVRAASDRASAGPKYGAKQHEEESERIIRDYLGPDFTRKAKKMIVELEDCADLLWGTLLGLPVAAPDVIAWGKLRAIFGEDIEGDAGSGPVVGSLGRCKGRRPPAKAKPSHPAGPSLVGTSGMMRTSIRHGEALASREGSEQT